ncbi:response regulator transcription factor [Streptomyces sp. NPDC058409]|uniref:helix-turn-helix transcriptional regulator n=1 Tax=Streptomyces sp. NPDC058409 TaxID=3346484 RepID=UPI00364EEDE3
MRTITRTGQNRPTVIIRTDDAITEAGLSTYLRHRPEVDLVKNDEISGTVPQVTLVVADTVNDDVRVLLCSTTRSGTTRTVLVLADCTEQTVFTAVGCGVAGVVPRSEATPERLVHVIQTVAAGDGYMPPSLVRALMTEIGELQNEVRDPRGRLTALSSREADVLRLVAEGLDTEAIAKQLAFSPRTIKSVLNGVMNRFQFRNRSQAVAYATRQGLI